MSISQILPHLYVSDYGSAQTKSVLAERNIKRIVSVTNRDDQLPLVEICKELDIQTKVFPIADTSFTDEGTFLVSNIFPWVRNAQDSGQTVLVHCKMGLSRSTSFIVAYLVWKGMDPSEAIRLVQDKHPDTNPWLDTMESFFECVGASVPAQHKDKSGERDKIK